MTSSLLCRVSAAVLLVAGTAVLFAPDVILPHLVPGYPEAALWLGQLLGAAWLGMAILNWSHRFTLLGGIYGRPVVAANLAVYLVSSLVLFRTAGRSGFSSVLWTLAAAAAVLAIAYAVLLFRGPLPRDLNARGAS